MKNNIYKTTLCILVLTAFTSKIYTQGFQQIQGVVYVDTGCVQAPYTGQFGLPGWTVRLCDPLGNVLDTAITDVSGAYTFENLQAGNFLLKVILQNGWEFSLPATGVYNISLMTGETALRNFGICQLQYSCNPIFTITPIGNCGNFQFTDQSTSPVPLGYAWDFDDPLSGANNTSSQQNPTHQFSQCGTYNVCLTITGFNCNRTVCHNVVFSEAVPPAISNCPPDLSLSTSPGQCVFDFPGPLPIVATDNCDPNPSITCTRTDPFGNTLPLTFPAQFVKGAHVIQCVAEDDCGNISQPCSFVLTIFDGEPPVLNCPFSMAFEGTLDMMGNCSAAINGLGPAASDNCIMLSTEYSISGATSGTGTGDASGTVFLPGISTVMYTVTDMGGNVQTCSFEVEVQCFPDEDDCLHWVKQIGGDAGNVAYAVAVDLLGNVCTAGGLAGTADFDPGAGVFNLSSSAIYIGDIFVSKLDANGHFLWAGKMGGPGDDFANAIAIDASGNIYTTGQYSGTADFDPGTGVFNLSAVGSIDVFISKLDANGNFVWAKSIGGSAVETGLDIEVDASGDIYIGGMFNGTPDFDPGAGVASLTSLGGNDAYILKLDASGNFIWVKHFGGTGPEGVVFSLAIDGSGNIHCIGEFSGIVDFDPGPGVFNIPSKGSVDALLVKLDPAGNLLWAKQMGGVQWDRGYNITTDASGFIYATGKLYGIADFDTGPGVFNIGASNRTHIFISKFDSSGDLVWAKSMGNNSFDNQGTSIASNPQGSTYTVGWFSFTVDFDTGPGAFNMTTQSLNTFITKMGTNGNFIRAKQFSGPSQINTYSVAMDPAGCIYTTGFFFGISDFDPGGNAFQLIPFGDADIFIHKMCPCSIVSTDTPVQDNAYSLAQAYPNPFSLSTTIEFHIPEASQVRLTLMDLYARATLVLINSRLQAGAHAVTLEAGNLPAGTYFYKLQAGSFSATRKLVVIR